jgi:Tfp pilus assembly protein PilX
MSRASSGPSRQAGFTMVVCLILLLIMTLVALNVFNLGKGSLQVIDNMQQRTQAQTAAQQTLDRVMSGTLFTSSPSAVFDNTDCPSGVVVSTSNSNGLCVDANGNGKTILTVLLSPQPVCTESSLVTLAQLNLKSSADQSCVVKSFIVGGRVQSNSLCSDTVWDLNAVASEATSEASVTVNEGVAVRTLTDNAKNFCK